MFAVTMLSVHPSQETCGGPSWSYMWFELKAGFLRGWQNPEDVSAKDPNLIVDFIGRVSFFSFFIVTKQYIKLK